MHILDELKERGLIYQISDEEALRALIDRKGGLFYMGFDPTAASLHVGSLLGIVFAKRLEDAGMVPVMLVGGATGLIGDPSGKAQERTLNTSDVVESMTAGLEKQIGQFNFKHAQYVNNYDWLGQMPLVDFLRDAGKYFTVNEMLAKESVKSRLETGISFTEFSYMLLQAYDFLKLHESREVALQIGGSDQWGNITAGIELVRKALHKEVYGLTMPLVTKADGKKMGKSEGGAVWLDATLTSPYHFYQFWLNVDDADVVKFLKYYTFLTLEEIAELERSLQAAPEKREAHKALAEAVTEFVHGKEALKQAQNISEALFGGDISEIIKDKKKCEALFVGNFAVQEMSLVYISGVVDFISSLDWKTPLSKRQAKEDIKNGAIEINGKEISDPDALMDKDDILFDRYIIVKRGKKNYHFVEIPE
ncbi:tyrosine--tRNA ligase [Candidatus Wolfebacteria bacterium RIFOXYD12_FULL_48_21]|uniref:Tyrosine--tRNA ligase n=1 Tax=Candidatus Wolfebacteria bacterium RIFOXYD1_FULL_48_65 TaxID=1802561 RepID=A0A1F8DYZ1_9BACT|nr:MAG: tyrosine--tRNA ligase [Candidatus Wolfebacteria bacterium RIFOXYD1_FULL_48_65]OGM94460.1 MAG: tyrosine--tRNA ligase [Candidatus Wolfebacteria bacterium RIFOXYD12_FULL_48_21]OGM97928.1 MAG: tyrosine--tRNA ligase [Candidatus Wolfebacteria bacterium RIFOXYD2_FULL_48_11]